MEKLSEVTEKLYHYTTWNGLLGILKTDSLWATHYKFLNDYSEMVLFKNRLITLMLPYVHNAYQNLISKNPQIELAINNEGGIEKVVRHDTEGFVNAQYYATGDNIYILSFCGQHGNLYLDNNGLLSQWRGYGEGGGCAIVFDTIKMGEIVKKEWQKYEYSAVHLSDIIYSGNEEKLNDEFNDDISTLAEDIKQVFHHPSFGGENKHKILKGYLSFVKCISRYKHRGFSEENEVRLVALPHTLDKDLIKKAKETDAVLKPEKEIKFRKANGKDIPYIELFKSTDIKLPIEKIIVGPHKDKETRAAALRVMLRKTGIEITCSDIPYIG